MNSRIKLINPTLALLCLLLINQTVACSDAKQSGASKEADGPRQSTKDKSKSKKSSATSSSAKAKAGEKGKLEKDEDEADDDADEVVGDARGSKESDATVAAMTPCALFNTIQVTGNVAAIKQQVCANDEFTQAAKAWLASPLTSSQPTPQKGIHYEATESGPTTKFKVNLATRHAVSCTTMVTEVGAKVLFAPRKLGNFMASLNETTQKVSDIDSVGGSHVGGSVYQTVDQTSGFMNKTDTFQFQVNAYSGASGSVYVSIEETTVPGTDMQNRTSVNLLQADGNNSCLSVSVTDITVANNGFHDTLVSSFLEPGLAQTLSLGFSEAQAARK